MEVESYYIEHLVITYAGVPHMGCNEMWVCPAFWPHFTQKVKQFIEKQQKRASGAGAPRGRALHARPLGFVVFVFLIAFSDDFACRHAVFAVNLGPWALERSDLTQSGGSGGRQPRCGSKN